MLVEPIETSFPQGSIPDGHSSRLDFQVEIVGPCPPPYGGVSVHCKRLLKYLASRDIDTRLWNVGETAASGECVANYDFALLSQSLNQTRPTIIHWHKFPDRQMLTGILLGRMTRSTTGQCAHVVTVHNSRVRAQVEALPRWKRPFVMQFWKRCAAIVFVTEQARQQGIELGCSVERAHVIPAYLPPSVSDIDPHRLPNDIQSFVASHSPVIAGGGWTIEYFDGVDLYGFDMMVDALARVREHCKRAGLIVCVPHIQRKDSLRRLQKRALQLGVNDAICWVQRPIPNAAAVWNAADVFVRPTVSDGDALSVREALHVGTPVVASDAVDRPRACLLFSNRDVDSFTSAIRLALNRNIEESYTNIDGFGFVESLVNLYEHIARSLATY